MTTNQLLNNSKFSRTARRLAQDAYDTDGCLNITTLMDLAAEYETTYVEVLQAVCRLYGIIEVWHNNFKCLTVGLP